MTNETKDTPDQTTLLGKVVKWIAGLTAVILALVGLREALQQLLPRSISESSHTYLPIIDSSSSAPTTQIAPADNQPPPQKHLPPSNIGAKRGSATTKIVRRDPAVITLIYPKQYLYSTGRITKSGKSDWIEYDDKTGTFYFSEIYRDYDHFILFDESRNVYLKIPTDGGVVYYSEKNPISWLPIFSVSVDKT